MIFTKTEFKRKKIESINTISEILYKQTRVTLQNQT
jgi:hypothetical protein